MKILLLLLLMISFACTKEELPPKERCEYITSIGYNYDADGNLINSFVSFYRWEFCGELLERILSRTVDTICVTDEGYLIVDYKIDSSYIKK